MRKGAARHGFRTAESADRERRKRLWLDPLLADFNAPAALEMARQHHVSLRLVAQVAGLIVTLDSFLDAGYVYASQAGLGRRIKNENGQPTSDRQVRRAIGFIRRVSGYERSYVLQRASKNRRMGASTSMPYDDVQCRNGEGRWVDVLLGGHPSLISACSGAYRQDPPRNKASRVTGRTTDQVRTRAQPQYCQITRAYVSRQTAFHHR
jgi:hypothetical protein